MDGLKLSPQTPADHQHNLRVLLGAAMLAGQLGGQVLYGGRLSGQHLELHSNTSEDGQIRLGDLIVVNESAVRLGIGTTAPAYPIDLVGSIASDALVQLQNTSAAGYGGIQVKNHSGSVSLFFGVDNANAVVRMNAINNHPWVFLTQSAERLRIDSNVAANQTSLRLAEGSPQTVRRVQWKAGNALVAGDKVMVLV